MKVKNIRIIKIIIKKIITDFCKDKFDKILIRKLINFLLKNSIILVRLLGFEPRASWSVAKRSIQLSYRRENNVI